MNTNASAAAASASRPLRNLTSSFFRRVRRCRLRFRLRMVASRVVVSAEVPFEILLPFEPCLADEPFVGAISRTRVGVIGA